MAEWLIATALKVVEGLSGSSVGSNPTPSSILIYELREVQ